MKTTLKKNLTLKDFHIVRMPEYVEWKEVEKKLGKRRYSKFMKWMSGQTCVESGVYPYDLERFLRNLPVID